MIARVSHYPNSIPVEAAPPDPAPCVRPSPGLALSHKPYSYPVSSPAHSPGRLIELL